LHGDEGGKKGESTGRRPRRRTREEEKKRCPLRRRKRTGQRLLWGKEEEENSAYNFCRGGEYRREDEEIEEKGKVGEFQKSTEGLVQAAVPLQKKKLGKTDPRKGL